MVESVSNICRICLQQIEENVQFHFLNNENGLMLQSKLLDFLPEIALNATQNPIICNRCTITIDEIHEFKQLCLRTESIIKDLTMQQKPFEDVLNYVKKNIIHETIKEELVEDTIIKDEPQIVDDDCLQVNTDLPVSIEAPTKPLFYCYTCDYNTDTQKNLVRHVHSHRPELPKIRLFKCDECSYTTPNNDCLSAHRKIHLKTEIIIKDLLIQQKPFQDVLNYGKKDTVHETIKEELIEDTIIKDEPQIVDDDCLQVNTDLPVCIEALTKPQLYCYTCNYNTVNKSNLVRHLRSHRRQLHHIKNHVIRMHNREKLVKNHKCDECDYSSVSKHNLKRHVIRKHYREKLAKNYKCGECDCSSVFKYSVNDHVNRTHNRKKLVKNYKCDECDYSSVLKHDLKSHVICMHNRKKIVKNHKCDECDYSSTFKHCLKRHVIYKHNREKLVKNHKCGECEYATNSKTTLVSHIRLHTGEKPYKCNICDYRSTQNGNLKAHLTTHNNEKSFKCKLCSHACNQMQVMKRHLQQHLKKPVLDCDKCSFKTLRNSDLKQHQLIHRSKQAHR